MMTEKIKSAFHMIDNGCEKIGKAVCLLIFFMMIITTVEVISRYVFNHPTMWVWPINRQLFGLFILFAGIYTMHKKDHIRVEILYDHLSPRMKSIARCIALACFLIFIIALILQGSRMAWMSWAAKERLSGAFQFPVYLLKILIPIAAFLFMLEGIVVFSRNNNKDY
jgi:TRAP-type mannitol/chloroaromatic compound transport system permease small subunit